MHHVQRTGLTARAVVGQLERRVRRRTLSFAGLQAMLEAELMTFERQRATLGMCGRRTVLLDGPALATASASSEFMAWAAARKQNKIRPLIGMMLARALVFLHSNDLLNCSICAA